ncbi:hypothetical protein PS15m_011376 [Mucor circinelloides]
MTESQLKLIIENAIIVPKTFEQISDHNIIKAYTLNPEGRVMLKVKTLLLSKVTEDIYDLSRKQSKDALIITASGSLLPSNQYGHSSSLHQYYPSILMVDQLSLMSDRVSIPIRVKQMMNEEAFAGSKRLGLHYSQPSTFSTTIYSGSTKYLNLLSGRGTLHGRSDDATQKETPPTPAGPLFSEPSLKSDTSRQGFKKFLDNTSIFRKRTINSSDDGFLKKARGFERTIWGTLDASYVAPANREKNDTPSEKSSNQHSHRLTREASKVEKYSK